MKKQIDHHFLITFLSILMLLQVYPLNERFVLPERPRPGSNTAMVIHKNTFVSSTKKEAFDRLLQSYAMDVSVYFHLLDENDIYLYQENTMYYPASLFKVPLALYLYQADERKELNLDKESREEISRIVSCSDNSATSKIAISYGIDRDSDLSVDRSQSFEKFLDEIGVQSDIYMCGPGYISGEINVKDMGKIMEILYHYFETGTKNALELKSFFKDYVYDIELLETGSQLYKKYGRYDEACHDVAIGYDPQPFILCVLTNGGEEGEEMMDPDGIMQSISHFVTAYYLKKQ